ncbi:Dolichyl-diphosphooligosaccharide--protein glycosyltransferase subunit STT3B [Heterocephalus glaber]|uniref:dolichyl-diphosphooligosaccharide--protein glycotransferase n=1 Tax=Heterocephalus glaber TaxID=10181 RepID=G5BHR0_HETGA|nr:Dolichyl-diphosphooligosaccharide--protein glycosyltransferase subunit STT3B [Heterocephalus glaber]
MAEPSAPESKHKSSLNSSAWSGLMALGNSQDGHHGPGAQSASKAAGGAAPRQRLFAFIRFESIIHEFDPWFNYRSTHHLASHGFYEFLNWFDERAWYPLGRIVGGTVKSVKTGSVFSTMCCCLSYFYMVSAWGGYVFIINLIPLHVFVLLLMQRYSKRVYIACSTFYIVGLILSMQIPFVGFQPIRTSEHMAAAGVFELLQAYAFLQYLRDRLTKQEFQTLFFLGVSLAAGAVFLSVIYLTYTGYIAPWSGRFYSLWDTGYAKIHIPIIASVSEHQPTTWVSFFFDLHILVCTFPAGLWFCIKNINDERVFVALYAISAVYFAGVMVRLMVTLTPVICMLSAIAFSNVFEHYLGDDMKRENPPVEDSSDEDDKRNPGNLYDKMRTLDVDYVLVIFGGVIGYSGDDINKFLWMVRIAEGEHPKDIRESDYFTPQGEFRVDKAGSPTLLNCLMYKMSYYRFGEMQLDFHTPPGFD